MTQDKRRYWFRAKRYGWGWGLPISWQGWLVLALWLAVLFLALRYRLPHGVAIRAAFVIAMSLLLVAICYLKGEPPRWRWGSS